MIYIFVTILLIVVIAQASSISEISQRLRELEVKTSKLSIKINVLSNAENKHNNQQQPKTEIGENIKSYAKVEDKIDAPKTIHPDVQDMPKKPDETIHNTESHTQEITAAKPANKTDFVRERQKEPKGFDFENLFMGNLFGKIGALAVVIGMAIFVKLISPFIHLTPMMQVALAYMAGTFIFLASLVLHSKSIKPLSEVLMGTAFAVFLVTTFCACSVQKVMPVQVETVICLFFICASYIASYKYKTVSTMAIGLFGGYLCPFFIDIHIQFSYLFLFLLFLNLITMAYTSQNQKLHWINTVNLLITMFVFSIHSAFSKVDVSYQEALLPIILWPVHLINNLFYRNRYTLAKVTNWLIFVALLFLLKTVICDAKTATIVCFAAILVYLSMGVLFHYKDEKTARNFYSIACMSIIFFSFFCASFFESPMIATCLFSLESIMFIVLEYIYKPNFLKKYSIASLSLAFATLMHVDNFTKLISLEPKYPILNERLVLLGLPALCAFVSSRLVDKKETLREIFGLICLSFVYLFAIFEISAILKTGMQMRMHYFASIIIGFIYSVNAGFIAKKSKLLLFNVAAYLLFGISLISLLVGVIYCAGAKLDYVSFVNLKFFAFLSAILASMFFAKKSKSEVFNALAIVLGAFGLYSEFNHLLIGSNWSNAILSLVWLGYSSIIMIAGIFANAKVMKITGIVLAIMSLIKLVFYDLANIDNIYKMFEFILLGLTLLVVSYFYATNNKNKN